MEIVVSIGLLVAVLAWVFSVYQRLLHLRAEVRGAWQQWLTATHRRNECLADFAEHVSLLLPGPDAFPARLQRLTDDSELALEQLEEPRWGDAAADGLPGVEWRLLRAVHESVAAVEQKSPVPGDAQLHLLCGQMSAALQRQENRTRLFNRAAQEYNTALCSPGGRMLAPMFGFLPAESLDTPRLRADREMRW